MPKILVVDDDPNIALLLKITLSKLTSYDIEIAHNGEEALNLVDLAHPDIILLDIMMPGIDGFEVCKRLKADDKTRLIPIIMITAKREIDDRLYGIDTGAVDYITKPFNPEELVAKVKVHLKIRQLEKELSDAKELGAALKMSVTLQHEINNPLTGIMGNAELLKERDSLTKEETDQAVSDILSLSLRVKEIVRQLSTISRVVSTPYIEDQDMIDVSKSFNSSQGD